MKMRQVNAKIFREVLADLSTHGVLSRSCRELRVHQTAFHRFRVAAKDGNLDYIKAKLSGMHAYADEMIDIADDKLADPAVVRNQIDVRKWLLAKLLPQQYGDRIELTGSLPMVIVKDMTGRKPAIEGELVVDPRLDVPKLEDMTEQ
jgi:hypothetical protein